MIDQSQAQQIVGHQLHTSDGDKVGTIGQVYIDDYYSRPEWVTVKTGLFGTNESFVPLAEATLSGNDVVVPYTKAQIKDAPNIDDSGHLSATEEQELYEYYNIQYSTEGTAGTEGTTGTAGLSDSSYTDRTTTGTGTADTGTAYTEGTSYSEGTTGTTGTTGYDTSGPTTDDAMTRSEEQLNVGTERVQAGKARLRKWVETENVQVDVPIRTEKARLVTEPITDANRGDAYDGPAISEEEHEVVLNTERPVVSKETVAQERVRLDTEVEEHTETVDENVRKERIDLEGDVDSSGRVPGTNKR